MKLEIAIAQLESLSQPAQLRLHTWFVGTHYTSDDQLIHVYIPQEKPGEYQGEFLGQWSSEKEFIYPEPYIGDISHHDGTILPLMNIGQLMQFLEDHQRSYLPRYIPPSSSVCDSLWQRVQAILEVS